ncbi:S8 family serine peptidase [Miltoncostaea marina]|uniref:S8 family serine peptidase n=1 Tax=Miltoncostaea marina TaxID=2843215 RepID=UPI001C3C45D5|nr:S8 family serine peptidase [Miltoncostaea marina]
MRRAALLLAGAALAGGSAAALVPGAAAAPGAPVAISVDARPGHVATAVGSLGRSGLRVQRRVGARLQVVAAPRRARALAGLPGVAGAHPATAAFGDAPAVSQGVERTGADVLGRVAGGGEGITIAVLDLGFGQNVERMQSLGELPPSARLETLSFDAVNGLAGRNAYGNRTNHGEIVAQTVYDYAPQARYLLVNYHSEADFVAATEAVIARHPDIVVHSNSFIEGPFDGTGPAARAVDRAAAAGILWFNSAGNYARQHWSGPWADADGDDALDWPNGGAWTFFRGAGQPVTFALSWTAAADGPAADLDLVLERQDAATGAWLPAAGSHDRQSAGAPPAERVVGYRPPVDSQMRLRVVRAAGPAPVGPLTLFSREIALGDIGGTLESSVPTPGDAAGAIAVGAVDWRGNQFKSYSSQGPSDAGLTKPDLVAPTDTRIMGPNGFRAVGGTSNAAPNAAGAAAVLLAAERRAGRAPTAGEIRAALLAGALDLGAPGPDDVYGAGRVRVSLSPPRVARPSPAPRASVRGRVTVRFRAVSRSRVTDWTLAVDGAPAVRRPQRYPRGITIDTRRLADGWHLLSVGMRDFPGNAGAHEWPVLVDNTRPRLVLRRVETRRARPGPPARRGGPRVRRRAVRLVVAAADRGSTGRLRATVRVTGGPAGAEPATRSVRLRQGPLVRLALGRPLAAGRYRVRVELRDRAGNLARVVRTIRVR